MSILSLQSSLGDGLAKSLEHPAIEGGGSMPEHTHSLKLSLSPKWTPWHPGRSDEFVVPKRFRVGHPFGIIDYPTLTK